MIQLNRLALLRELAARGTITAVAESLAYTPSAVSQQLSALERDLGVTLLERRGRGVVLTAAGQALADGAAGVFAAAEAATSAAVAAAESLVGPVHVGSFASIGATVIPRAFAALRWREPALQVHFRQFEDEGNRELRLGHLDIWLDQHYTALPGPDAHGLVEHQLFTEPVCLAVPAARDQGPDLAAYREEPWAGGTLDTACGRLLRRLTDEAGFEPEVRYLTDDLEVTLQLVASGVAIALLPRLATARVPVGVSVHALDGVERRMFALTRPAALRRPVVALVLEELVEAGVAADAGTVHEVGT